MAINHVEIRDFLMFKNDFVMDFCPGINVLTGGNGTGKTTLIRALYGAGNKEPLSYYFSGAEDNLLTTQAKLQGSVKSHIRIDATTFIYDSGLYEMKQAGINDNSVYIPEKDILEHAKGLLTFIEQKRTGFSQIYKDILVNAQDIPTQKQSVTQEKIGKMIAETIGGTVHWDKGEGSFYTLHTDGTRIPFANEASGYKKFGFLGLLVTSGQLAKGAVLFWDEPENSLNPELMPVLTDILLELSRAGVQIFIATHSEILASYLDVSRKSGDDIMFYSLYKAGDHIKSDKNERFEYLRPNKLSEAVVKLYKEQLKRGTKNGGR
jgi:predicted ATP-dependent endonuclease of OLD family